MSALGGRTPRELAVRARDGDEAAFAELLRRYEGAVFRLALQITGNRAEAEDAAQESFLRAYRALPRFDVGRPFGPWILKIAANRALTRVGRRSRESPLEAASDKAEKSPTMDEALGVKEEVERVREGLKRLAPLDRAILMLRYDQDQRLAEIARTLGIREGAAKVRLFRARERLMRLLKEAAAK